MTVVIVVVAIALAAILIARATWRQGSGERHSVRNYQQALDTLRQMSDRTDGPSSAAPQRGFRGRSKSAGAMAGAEGSAAKTRTRHEVRQAVPNWTDGSEEPQAPRWRRPSAAPPGASARGATPPRDKTPVRPMLVFDDSVPGPPTPVPVPGSKDSPLHDGPRFSGRSLRPLIVAVAVAVVAAVIALVVVGLSGSGSSPPVHHSASSTKTASHHATTPRVTTPPPPQALPTDVTPTSATYKTTSSAYTVDVTAASGECWIMARNLATGAVVWQGLILQGGRQPLPASGPLELELGAASAAQVTLDGVQVVLPFGFHSPFYATFEPA